MQKTLFLALLLSLNLICLAQQPTKTELEKQRAAVQKEIDDVKRSLTETQKNKKASMSQLYAVQKKLQLRQKEINVINQQMNLIEGDINQGWRDITKLHKELDTLKEQYAKSVVYSYKNRSNYDFLNFIFSASNFNDALKRVSYLKSYRSYREEQANNILRTQELIKDKITGLSHSKEQKTVVLKEESKAREILESEKKEQDEVVSKLKAREKELNKEFADKKKQDARLVSAITAAIRRATDAARAEAKRNAELAAKNNTNATTVTGTAKTSAEVKTKKAAPEIIPLKTEEKALAAQFERNRGSLPWPLDAGKISMRFGPQNIPGTPIKTFNQFLTFEAEAGRSTKAVFDGEVSLITYIGDVQAVIIRHGNYFTSYSGLGSVSVAKGQQVKTGQVIGKLAEKEDNFGELEFGVSNAAGQNLDPEKWLR